MQTPEEVAREIVCVRDYHDDDNGGMCRAHLTIGWPCNHRDVAILADFIRARDAEVRAETLREAAEEVYGDDRAAGSYSHPLSVASWLRERADRIDPAPADAPPDEALARALNAEVVRMVRAAYVRIDADEGCTCGFGGVHDDVNPRCVLNQPETGV